VTTRVLLCRGVRSSGVLANKEHNSGVSFESVRWGDNRALEQGGAVAVSGSDLNVADCTLLNNFARNAGGGFHVKEGSQIAISRSWFEGNIVLKGPGSAIWMSDCADDMEIGNNSFLDNKTPLGGGTVYWSVSSGMSEPVGLGGNGSTSLNFFADTNTALYGEAVATDAYRLRVGSKDSDTYEITDYTTSHIPLDPVYLVDYYDQVVRSESTAVVLASVLSTVQCHQSNTGYVTDGIVERVISGESNFTSLSAFCDPGYSMPLSFTSTTNNLVLSTYVEVEFRECVVGEYYGDHVCSTCRDGTYSLTDPVSKPLAELSESDVCKDCPSGSSNCYGSTIEVHKGYWRVSNDATTLLSCPYGDSACKGGTGSGDALCRDGYTGT
jgi:hypothetical protein